MLDESFRRRVAAIGTAAESALDDEARERIFGRIAADGPGLVRAGRRSRTAWLLAGPALAAAAAAALIVGRGPSDARSASSSSPSSAVAAAGQTAAAVTAACASRSAATGAAFVVSAGASRLDLGVTAVASAAPGSVVRLAEASPCRTIIALESGTVTVHAKDLGGGELKVRAPGGEVTVHGTLFAVTQSDDSFAVEVAEGRVAVASRLGTQFVSRGERVMVSALGLAEGQLADDRVRALRAAVGVPQVLGLDTLPAAPEESTAPAPGALAAGRVPARSAESASRVAARGADPVEPPAAEATPAPPVLEETPVPAVSPEVVAPPQNPLALAEEARRAGDFARARELYRVAGDGTGVTAEAAWLALARMELSLGHADLARSATKRRRDRFGQGTLEPEAQWIDVRAYRQTGDMARARELAAELIRRWPTSAQAIAARRWLGE